jgi:predicted permease
MNVLATIARRLRMLLRGTGVDRDLEEEMRLHMDLRSERIHSSGVSKDEAGLIARRRFGPPLRHREASVDVWGWRWLEQLVQDTRFAVRTLRKSPGFTATVVLTLALATGASTSIFSVVNGVILRPLPFASPEGLVKIYGRKYRVDQTTPDPLDGPVDVIEMNEYVRQNTTFDGFTGHFLGTIHLDGADGPERFNSVSVLPNFFSILKVLPIVGRTFATDDGPDVVVISGRLWESRFARDPSLPGRAISIDGRPHTVIGVMPDDFQYPYQAASLMDGALHETRTDVWVPANLPPNRGRVFVTARLKPDTAVEAAQSELNVIAPRVQDQFYRGTEFKVGARVVPLADEVVEPVRRSLWMLLGAVGLVLVAACANVANLLLARTTARASEVVTRTALGAGTSRLVRQFLAEGLMLSLAGGLIGALLAVWGTHLLVALAAAKIPRAHEVSLDWRVFVLLFLACVTIAAVFGIVAAHAASKADSQLARQAGHATMGRAYGRVRDGLVVAEVSLAFILALGAALVAREAIRLKAVPSGVVTENVLTLHLTPRAEASDYYAIAQRVSAMSGVRGAGFTQLVPLQNWGWEAQFTIYGRPTRDQPVAGLRYVTPGYFDALGIQVVNGRGFTDADAPGAPRVIVVNEALVRRYLPDSDPVGMALDRGTIVGVIGDVRQSGLHRPAEPEIFYPAAQNVTMASDVGMSLVVRTDGPPGPLIGAIRAAVRDVNPRFAIFNVKTMNDVIADSLWELTLYRVLITLFAALALLLAAMGLFGVMSYNATSRMREFAVRLALGSNPAGLGRLVLERGALLAVAGLAVGALVAEQLLLLFGGLPIGGRPDLVIYLLAAAVLLSIALVACVIPAIRVTLVDPATALRQE